MLNIVDRDYLLDVFDEYLNENFSLEYVERIYGTRQYVGMFEDWLSDCGVEDAPGGLYYVRHLKEYKK